jgi:hypothetical protein
MWNSIESGSAEQRASSDLNAWAASKSGTDFLNAARFEPTQIVGALQHRA